MNSKLLSIAAVAIVLAAGAAIAVSALNNNPSEAAIQFEDSYGRKIALDKAPERVAVVNTDIAYFMQILGIESTVIGMDVDGLDKIKKCSDKYSPGLVNFGKRSAFSTSTTIEKLLASKIDTILTPTSMGIGSTVLADVIEDKGIKVVYLNAYGSDMLRTMDMMVTLFGGSDELKQKSAEYKTLFNSYRDEAKSICPNQDKSIDYLYYMSSSSGSLGSYYLSSSEMDTIVSSLSGTNRAQSNSGSFSQYLKEALVALYYNDTAPAVDKIFIRGTDDYTLAQVMDVFDGQELPTTYKVSNYMTDNSSTVQAVYVNTHLASGMMCCFSYLIYAYVFAGELNSEHIAHIEEKTNEFMTKYGFEFVIDTTHPVCKIIDY